MANVTHTSEPPLSGERFSVIYRLSSDEKESREKARDITLEQTVEFPDELVPSGKIRNEILGRIESFNKIEEGLFDSEISYSVETAGNELPQLLNLIFGNSSIKPGIRVENIIFSKGILDLFKGPRFGVEGLRALLKIEKRPLLCTALKPMGLSPSDLADMTYKFAAGGIDIIKDDHGLADQSFPMR
jgi:ribulose-bisphosphate carboxylase large chain